MTRQAADSGPPTADALHPSSPAFDRVYDFAVVGSGFGGSVAALRLAEKGYSVVVLEKGRRWRPQDYPATNWNLRKFFWAPPLFCQGIQQITLLKDVLVLHGAGVGGGSLVYANTLMPPAPEAFRDPKWRDLADWERTLAPHYATVAKMLGVERNPRRTPADEAVEAVAREMGVGETFHPTDVAVFFGEPNRDTPDPYFGGEGPPRQGCNFCGGCMVGCRFDAKNTLDKNYLYLAEKRGAVIVPETRVRHLERTDGAYRLHLERATALWRKRRRTLDAKRVVLAAGVLGTVPLLLECRRRGTLPDLSDQVGRYTRTNSEALLGVTAWKGDVDHSAGLAIGSHFYLKDGTRAEPVRYSQGSDVMALLGTPLTDGGTALTRPLTWLWNCVSKPRHTFRVHWPFGKARRTVILLLMQTADNRTSLVQKRRWWWPFGLGVTSRTPDDHPPVPPYIPVANEIARRVAAKLDGVPQSALNEVLLNASTTAHILGGAAMGRSPEDGVCDARGRVFGCEGLFVCDGSLIGANLGVNPSFTIAALAEHVCEGIPAKADAG